MENWERTHFCGFKPPRLWALCYGRPRTLTHTSASRPVLGSLHGSHPPRTPTLVPLGRVYLDAPRAPQLSFPAAGPGRAPVVAPGSWSRCSKQKPGRHPESFLLSTLHPAWSPSPGDCKGALFCLHLHGQSLLLAWSTRRGPKVLLSCADLPPLSRSPPGGQNVAKDSSSHQVRLLLNSQSPSPLAHLQRRTRILAAAWRPGLSWPCLISCRSAHAPRWQAPHPSHLPVLPAHPLSVQGLCPCSFLHLAYLPPPPLFLWSIAISSLRCHLLREAFLHPRQDQAFLTFASCVPAFPLQHLSLC
ncbi:uncharacterized protein [Physeter macrocephalus]|uniref:Uncharacterized protein n=1 Tax=Physeter macrocephalus TaxID=9755 RepID=A0A9W2WZB1_PHYMC|nr:uncharacterized protein LOC114487075 [Physeter catodon]